MCIPAPVLLLSFQGRLGEAERLHVIHKRIMHDMLPSLDDPVRHSVPTLRMQLQPGFHGSSLNALDLGSGR